DRERPVYCQEGRGQRQTVRRAEVREAGTLRDHGNRPRRVLD
ncbi:unnamed protein product, partial [Ectocarpus sp. 13 AM-2016]